MINILDNQKAYGKLDSGRVAESIESLAAQMKQVVDEADFIKVPAEYRQANQVVVNGMGGSNIGIGLIKSALGGKIKAPITITAGYFVPAMVNNQTLYIISSYSGNTEESLSVYDEVKKRGAKIMAIGEAGDNQLARLMSKDHIPGYSFKPENNPSGQPRLGLGYSVIGVAMLLYKSGLLEIDKNELSGIISKLDLFNENLKVKRIFKANLAKRFALKLHKKIPVLVGAEFLTGNLGLLRNQFNETSKNFAAYFELPDMNHFALEGLSHPQKNKDNLIFFFFDSDLYHPRVVRRAELTKRIVKKNKIKFLEHRLTGGSKFEQAMEMLQLGAWVTYYLAMLNNVNPVKIKWVDWFKKELG